MIRSVLVVDDDVSVASSVALAVSGTGRSAIIASGAHQARAVLATGHFDCIITDWRMPDGDGLSFAAATRRRGDAPPIILMSAYATDAMADEAIRAGCSAVLPKPVDLERLEAALAAMEDLRRDERRIATAATRTDLVETGSAATRGRPTASASGGLDPRAGTAPRAVHRPPPRGGSARARHSRSRREPPRRRRRGAGPPLAYALAFLLAFAATLAVGLLTGWLLNGQASPDLERTGTAVGSPRHPGGPP